MKIKHNGKECHHEWEYKGDKRYPAMVACPYCGNKVRVPKEEVR